MSGRALTDRAFAADRRCDVNWAAERTVANFAIGQPLEMWAEAWHRTATSIRGSSRIDDAIVRLRQVVPTGSGVRRFAR
jgi:hypothetical protein